MQEAHTAKDIVQHVEVLIFCSPKPLPIEEIMAALSQVYDDVPEVAAVELALAAIEQNYRTNNHVLGLHHIGGGYQFLSKPPYMSLVAALLKVHSKRKLSKAALETLAIIAYEQPITSTRMEQIRGVQADYALRKLIEHQLIEVQGKAAQPGSPLLYGTTSKFLDFFGINALRELPSLKAYEGTLSNA